MRHLLQLKRAAGVSSMYNKTNKNRENLLKTYTSDDEEEDEEIDGGSQPSSPTLVHKSTSSLVQGPAEWIGITTNSEEDCSYSSADNSESQLEYSENNFCEWNDYVTPILNSNCAIGDRSECGSFFYFLFMFLAKSNASSSFFSIKCPYSKLYHLGWT